MLGIIILFFTVIKVYFEYFYNIFLVFIFCILYYNLGVIWTK